MGVKRYKKPTSSGQAKLKTQKSVAVNLAEIEQSASLESTPKSTSPTKKTPPASAATSTSSSPKKSTSTPIIATSRHYTPTKNDYFAFPVKLIYSDLTKAISFSCLIFIFLFVLSRYFNV